jgi:hypothetical protein
MLKHLIIQFPFLSGLAIAALMIVSVITGPRWLKFKARFKLHRIIGWIVGSLALLHLIDTLYIKFFMN